MQSIGLRKAFRVNLIILQHLRCIHQVVNKVTQKRRGARTAKG